MAAPDRPLPDRHVPPRRFLRQCRLHGNEVKVADSTGRDLTGGKLLVGALLFKRLLDKHVLAADESNVGVLLPPSVAGAVINAGLALGKRVAVNLNYTLTEEQVNDCIKQAGIKHVLTSKAFLEKKPYKLDAEVVLVENLRPKATKLDTAICAFWGFLTPVALLERRLGLTSISPDDLLTIIFTSGSTGEPKGVMLSHGNVGANVTAIEELIHLRPDETMLGVLPFFHAFGYTVTLWWPLCLTTRGVYHVNPLDARTIGELCERFRATVMVVTPTFLRAYLKRCEPQQLATLEIIISGAEKLPSDLTEAFQTKFGVTPCEGYGATELSPVVSCNIPDSRTRDPKQKGTKAGTVGRALPGVLARVVDPESGQVLPTGSEGRLMIGGPTVMRGYLHQPEKTAGVVRDGWYDTGDIASLDGDGFITIAGRLSRFSKIGGEMVPHLLIEEGLLRVCAGQNQAEQAQADTADGPLLAVTAVPDERRGERIVVLHRPLPLPVDALLKQFAATGVPNLWLPDRGSFVQVEAIPVLGSGKLDLKLVREMADESAK